MKFEKHHCELPPLEMNPSRREALSCEPPWITSDAPVTCGSAALGGWEFENMKFSWGRKFCVRRWGNLWNSLRLQLENVYMIRLDVEYIRKEKTEA